MSKLRHVLKLHTQGVPKLQISTATRLSRNTVRRYLTTFTELKTTWEALKSLSDKELYELFHLEPVVEVDERVRRLHEFLKQYDKKMSQRGMKLGKLHGLYTAEQADGFRSTAFYKHYRLWKRRISPSMHMEHVAGDKMYVDYTGVRLRALDTGADKLIDVEVFVAILGASQMTYVEAVASQKAEDFIACCENALHYFGGAPGAIEPDNLKAAVIKTHRFEPRLNQNFEGFADHYGMTVLPARACRPKDKALVEGAVKIAYNKIFTALPEGTDMTLPMLNRAIGDLLVQHNSAMFHGRDYSRMDLFLESEQQALQALPEHRYEMRSALQATTMKNGHICLSTDKHYYSVPYTYIGKKMRVLFSASTVEIFYKYEPVARHDRSRRAYGYTTDDTHLASHHKAASDWNPEFFLGKARVIGAEVETYLEHILMKKAHPEQAYKTCQGILSFAHRVGQERLRKACARAHAFETYTYRSIEDILKRGIEDAGFDTEQLTMPTHENIRGSVYYAQTDTTDERTDEEEEENDDADGSMDDDISPTPGDDDE